MPILNREDAAEVDEQITRIFAADHSQRPDELRRLFVEKLDFSPATGTVSLAKARKGVVLPENAERLATMSGVTAVYIALDDTSTNRVRKAEAAEVARLVSDELAGDILLVFMNSSNSQVHFIYPTFEGSRPSLRRLVIERDLPRRTAVQQLSNIYWEWEKTGDILRALESTYDVEAVTTEFFRDYKRVFDHAMDGISGFGVDESEQEAKKLFVQTLFNRLMFVYFLSRKGWLTFNDDNDYLNALWRDYPARSEDKNFYEARLKTLFFLGLNNDRSSKELAQAPGLKELIGDPPFLNGGLFDKGELDDRTGILVPDESIEMILSELFDRFNFTVMESTPLDVEVAVDPEMLGKVFEELVTGRHSTGSYYTPRPIVAFMAREALKGYLKGEVPELTAETVHRFVDDRDVSSLNFGTAEQVRKALENVTILDPACGSGAYLVGMLQELVELETALYSERLVRDPHSLYSLKMRIIEQNLYGSDIDRFAVNIAMLRLWLSLAIDYEGDHPEPLPNLDFKIVCGDSLTSPDPAPEHQLRLFADRARGIRERLEAAKARFMTAVGPEKIQVRQQIWDMESELEESLADRADSDSSLEWRVQFAEVFDRRGGFDIVIANPPYRRHEGLGSRKADLEKLYPQVYASTADYHVYFYNRSVQLLKEGGELAFITSNKYMRAQYGEKIRGFLSAQLTLSQVVDFGDLPVFTAASYPAVVIGRKEAPPEGHELQVAELVMPVRRDLARRRLGVNKETVARRMDDLPSFIEEAVSKYPQVLLRRSGWILEEPALVRLFERLMGQGTPLGKFVKNRIYRGIVTGLNDAFVIDQAKRDELISEDPRSADIIKPWLQGKNIKRWRTEWPGTYVLHVPWTLDLENYPAVWAHLQWFREQLEQRPEPKRGLYPWYAMSRWASKYHEEFAGPKVVWGNLAVESKFAMDLSGAFICAPANFLIEPAPWLLAVLNSALLNFVYPKLTVSRGGSFQEFKTGYIEPAPIIEPPAQIGSELGKLQARLIEPTLITQGEVARLEVEIDDLVYDAYNVKPTQRRLLAEWAETRRGLDILSDDQYEAEDDDE